MYCGLVGSGVHGCLLHLHHLLLLLQEFKCEICGNASYWGRRAFERHFKEYLHQNGMRALGIPNTKLFFEVTKISDAQELWKNVQVLVKQATHLLSRCASIQTRSCLVKRF